MYEHPRFLLRAEERLRRMCFGGRVDLTEIITFVMHLDIKYTDKATR